MQASLIRQRLLSCGKWMCTWEVKSKEEGGNGSVGVSGHEMRSSVRRKTTEGRDQGTTSWLLQGWTPGRKEGPLSTDHRGADEKRKCRQEHRMLETVLEKDL